MLLLNLPFYALMFLTLITQILVLSLHDALPIFEILRCARRSRFRNSLRPEHLVFRPNECTVQLCLRRKTRCSGRSELRSEEHTSELQSHHELVCRLLLVNKKFKALMFLTLMRPS